MKHVFNDHELLFKYVGVSQIPGFGEHSAPSNKLNDFVNLDIASIIVREDYANI